MVVQHCPLIFWHAACFPERHLSHSSVTVSLYVEGKHRSVPPSPECVKIPPGWLMDGSRGARGATGVVDVGVSHLNMNINVTAGGVGTLGVGSSVVGLAGAGGSSDSTGGGDSSSVTGASTSSPQACQRMFSLCVTFAPRLFCVPAQERFCDPLKNSTCIAGRPFTERIVFVERIANVSPSVLLSLSLTIACTASLKKAVPFCLLVNPFRMDEVDSCLHRNSDVH